ncbi:MAG: hypothetical protein K2X35_22795 [Bryobacteraceae bacterium]|nr:hypothetical protein [Bryobacteraceae bacterium]
MDHLVVLISLTTIVIALAGALWRRTRDVSVLLGSAALYYWSLFGAWGLITDKRGGFSGKNYHYLEQKLFPISLDSAYLETLLLYGGFVIVAQVTLLVLGGRRPDASRALLDLHHGPVLTVSLAAMLASIWLMRDQLSTAWVLNVSAYHYTRFQGDALYTLRQLLNRVALIPAAITFAVLMAGGGSRYFRSHGRRWHLAAYGFLFFGMGAFTFVLGNKNEVLVALLCGCLVYIHGSVRPNLGAAAMAGAAGMWFLYLIDYFRATPIASLTGTVTANIRSTSGVAQFVSSSNEAYGSHFSLYGVLSSDVPLQFGYSIYSLLCSVVPRILWPDRPSDIYEYYTRMVGAMSGQGYSVHHATGWYLNFGMAGVLLGGAVLGGAWAFCLNAWRSQRVSSPLIMQLFSILAPWLFAANLPPLIRAGPEGYKGLIVDCMVVPLLTLALASRRPRTAVNPSITARQHDSRIPGRS